MKFNIFYALKSIFPIFILFLTACTPLMHSTRYGDQVKVVSNDGDISCTPVIFFWGKAQEECQKIKKNSSLEPINITTTKNRFCQSTGVYQATYTCQAENTNSQKPPISRLNLKVLQTRKFNKPPQEVAQSINELYKDKSQRCVGVSAPVMICSSGSSAVRVVNGKPTTFCTNPGGSPTANQKLIKHPSQTDGFCLGNGVKTTFSIDEGKGSPSSTILRIRIAEVKVGSRDETQLTDPEVYRGAFKEIADGLFIDAIGLTPAEMQ